MADALPKKSAQPETKDQSPQPEPMFDLIELFFFAYRDFVGDADRLLTRYNFGRAHHRVLYFVDRRPGLSVAELLDLLKITKQSLSRVLKDLLDQNYIEQHPGLLDRRQRLMFPTRKGEALALELAELQSRRFARALEILPGGARAQGAAFLAAMCDPAMCDPATSDPVICDPARGSNVKGDPATGGAS
ncbi:MarR family winged helix-turn-helix transcriptional regulator [Rhodoblastus sp.]|jgi:DNA-binding MarR family transcriptional regulator|uniref:MarR family winged helix-turn-helix transcriptional regulator n=1 Tax=Rhodoblastus sp. TaxID=1962975 RepID=UPI0025D3B763|nr:MarR family winged helix-turn-helix transcriptional regulator [Rhodoblastus sp.]